MIRSTLIALALVSVNLKANETKTYAQGFADGLYDSTLRDSGYRCSGDCKRVYIKTNNNDTVFVSTSGYPKARCLGSLKEQCAAYCQSYLFEGCHLENVSVY